MLLQGELIAPEQAARIAAQAAEDKQAQDIVVLDIGNILIIADYFVICSGRTDRQVRTIAEHVEKRMKESGLPMLGAEGEREGRWILLDYGAVVVHVFIEEERAFYQLERLWKDAPLLEWEA